MVKKHIIRNKDNHIKEIKHIGTDDEYIMFECFGTDYEHIILFTPQKNNIHYSNKEVMLINRMGVPSYISKNINPMKLNMNFKVPTGLYSIEIMYEQHNKLHVANHVPATTPEKYDSSKDLLGSYKLTSKNQNANPHVKVANTITDYMPDTVKKQIEKINNYAPAIEFKNEEQSIKFDGENNVNKRKIFYKNLTDGEYNLELNIPSNCYFKGMILRKVVRYWSTNTEEVDTNVFMKHVELDDTEMIKPRNVKVTLAYDDILESLNNPNGFSIGYNDECNLFVKTTDDSIVQIFGGYVDDISKSDTTFELTCKDRLRDTEKRYIMDYLTIQNGTKKDTEHKEYKNFTKYEELLKFLCDVCEVTLKNNIPSNYWINTGKYSKGHVISFGKKKDIKKVTASNGTVTVHNNSIVLRNNDDGLKKQVFKLYSTKKPIDLNSIGGLHMHLTIGMGNPKTSQKIKETVDVSKGDEIAGAVNWSKCGVSPNKKYVMGIGQGSAGQTSRKYDTGYWRSIFKNKCPNCKREGVLRWDSARTDTKCIFTHGWNGSKRTWGIPETEITCTACDSDFDAVSGWEKMPASKKRLKTVKVGLKSSKHEQDLLHKGKLKAPVTGNVHVTAEEVFKAIKNSVKGFKYGAGSTAHYLEKHHTGDCHAWSEKIKKELMKYKVNCKIVEYPAISSNHRSVLYQNKKGKYVDFPYREYNFPTLVRNTPNSKNGKVVDKYTSGSRIDNAVSGSSSTSKTETKEVTVTKGYDVNAPIKGYFDIVFSVDNSKNKKHVYIGFTLNSKSNYEIDKFKPVFVNNSIKQFTIKDILGKIRNAYNLKNTQHLYLHGINFITPKMNTEEIKNEKSVWYTNDKTTKDDSSCKMILYKISFDDKNTPDPIEYESCGKTVNELMNTVVTESTLLVDLNYGRHRSDDVLNFRINNNVIPSFYASDNSNILEWSNINYNDNNSLFNKSICVFKKNVDGKYYYIEKWDMDSVLLYGEKPTVQVISEETSISEAYWNVRHDTKYNPKSTYEYEITVMGYPNVKLDDLINIDSDNDKLDDIKVLKSISMVYDPQTRPSIRTRLGLNEKEEDLHVRDIIKKIKEKSLKENTHVKSNVSIIPIADENEYSWEY